MISKQDAAEIADKYLKTKNIDWGKPISVTVVRQGSSVLVEDENKKKHEESWMNCYYVQYVTPAQERELTGLRTVIVSQDGSKVAIPLGC